MQKNARAQLCPLQQALFQSRIVRATPETLALIDEVNEPNLGIGFDTWHLGETPNVIKQIIDNANRTWSGSKRTCLEEDRRYCASQRKCRSATRPHFGLGVGRPPGLKPGSWQTCEYWTPMICYTMWLMSELSAE
jgi:hypothetical protein